MSTSAAVVVDVDDCWNRIGVQGNATCAELAKHTHCRNCDVYSRTARRLLNVPLPDGHVSAWTEHFAQRPIERKQSTQSALVFRSGNEWFALPTSACVEVTAERTIHTLPHRRSSAVSGLVNVRGELVVCISLASLLGVATIRSTTAGRLLIIGEAHERTALEVNEITGTHAFGSDDQNEVPRTLAGATTQHIRATLRWRDHTVALLDPTALLASIRRSLA